MHRKKPPFGGFFELVEKVAAGHFFEMATFASRPLGSRAAKIEK